jgi:hypothetical protein
VRPLIVVWAQFVLDKDAVTVLSRTWRCSGSAIRLSKPPLGIVH